MMGISGKALAFGCTVLALSGALYAALGQQAADTPVNPFLHDPAAIAQGKAVYDSTCVACHEPGAVGGRGPALNTGNFTYGSSDYEVFQTIQGGIPGTQMPAFDRLPADNIWKIVTYLKNLPLQAQAAAAPQPVTGDATAGQALFFGKGGCAACHEVNGRGLDLASDLSEEGTKAVSVIHDGVVHRPATRGRGVPPHFADAVTRDGRTISGLVRAEDSFTVHLESRDGHYIMLDKAKLASLTTTGDAAPKDVEQRLSKAEIDNIVAFLAGQKSRDLSKTIAAHPAPVLTTAQMEKSAAAPQNWTSYWGDYQSHHFSELKQITPANVKGLQARWTAPMLGDTTLEATPIVVDGVMYVCGPPGDVYAFDARSGVQIWKFHRKQDIKNPYEINPYNKGLAVMDGRVFFGTLDNNFIALDAHTGRELWEKRLADPLAGYTLTGAPLAVKDKIIMGMSGGEMGVRGWIDAYDPATGKQLWRFYTIPKPGEPGGDTWPGDSWQYGGGATWLTGSYDVATNTLWWPIGNPGPDYNPDIRKGDNLYTDAVVGLDADTGQLKWHYQFTPNDAHDWDSTEDMVLADQVIDGKPRKLILHADRNGVFYVLDRENHKFLWAKPFVRVNWVKGWDANGKPDINPDTVVTPEGKAVFPTGSATNFQAPSYDKNTGIMYFMFNDSQGFVASAPATYEKGKQYLGRGTGVAPPAPPAKQGLQAMDTKTGKVLWQFITTRASNSSGVIATRGGMVFICTPEGQFIGIDMKTGKALWHYRVGGPITASPISYAVDGQQFIAFTAGNMVYAFALPDLQTASAKK